MKTEPPESPIRIVMAADPADSALLNAVQNAGGRAVDTGRGFIGLFPSAVDALHCALTWREGRSAAATLSLSMGSVGADGQTGEAVEEALGLLDRAGPGELWIADNVLGLVAGKVPLVFERVQGAPAGAGYRANFDADPNQPPPKSRRIPVFVAAIVVVALAAGGLWLVPAPQPPTLTELAMPENMALPLPDLPSLAVLPFEATDVPDHVAAGLLAETVRWLGTNPGLFVVDPAGTAALPDADSPARVAEALGVRFVFQGTLENAGDGVRLQGRLMDALTGSFLWQGTISADPDDLGALGRELAKTILAALGPQAVTPPDGQPEQPENVVVAATPAPVDPRAYDLFLQGRALMAVATPDANSQAQPLFQAALDIEPAFAAAAIEHGFTVYFQAQGLDGDLTGPPLPELEQSVRWAFAADPNNARGLALSSRLMMLRGTMFRGQFDDIPPRAIALDLAQRALAAAPNDPENLVHLARLYNFGIRTTQEGLELIQRAMRINPNYPWTYQLYLAQNYQLTGRYEEAIQVLLAALERKPDSPLIHRELALAYVLGDQVEAARLHMAELLRLVPGYSVPTESQESIYLNSLNLDRDVVALRRAGLPFAYREP